MDSDACYRAVRSKDARFDGVFFSAVSSTGIYCRPSCPAITPKRANLTFYPTAAAAAEAGYRACKRCRPDCSAGSPEWNIRADVVGRAMRLIADGVVDRDGVAGLAGHLNYSERHLHRQLVAEVGAGPQSLALAQRCRTARVLIENTKLPMAEVAFAAGFSSIRQFNDAVQRAFADTPTQLRKKASAVPSMQRGDNTLHTISLRLPYRPPMDLGSTLEFVGMRGITGVEEYVDGVYRRSVRLPHGIAVVELSAPANPDDHFVACSLMLQDVRDLGSAVQRCRRMLDVDADPIAIDDTLCADPMLRPLIAANPGLRMPGTLEPEELAVRVVIGQQVSMAGARTLASRLVHTYGTELDQPVGAITHLFPDAATLAEVDPAHLAMPNSRKRAIHALCTALASGEVQLHPGVDWDETAHALLQLHGIGPWTVAAIRMRGLGDPDVFLASDLGIHHALERLGLPSSPKAAQEHSQQWRPWRSYVTHRLWKSLEVA